MMFFHVFLRLMKGIPALHSISLIIVHPEFPDSSKHSVTNVICSMQLNLVAAMPGCPPDLTKCSTCDDLKTEVLRCFLCILEFLVDERHSPFFPTNLGLDEKRNRDETVTAQLLLLPGREKSPKNDHMIFTSQEFPHTFFHNFQAQFLGLPFFWLLPFFCGPSRTAHHECVAQLSATS